jgi:hypothetical protein
MTKTMITVDSHPGFFKAVKANAAFSSVCALLLLAVPDVLANWLGLAETQALTLMGIGAGLALFALRLLMIARAGQVQRAETRTIIGGDIGWVVASVILLLVGSDWFSTLGQWIVVDIALVVMGFAVLQWRGLKGQVSKDTNIKDSSPQTSVTTDS